MSTTTAVVVSAHLMATVAMGGLIWFVQVVHYPMFAAVGDDEFVSYEAHHTQRTARVVGPIMAVEGLAALHFRDVLGGVEVVSLDKREAQDRGQLSADSRLAAAAGACYYYAKRPSRVEEPRAAALRAVGHCERVRAAAATTNIR